MPNITLMKKTLSIAAAILVSLHFSNACLAQASATTTVAPASAGQLAAAAVTAPPAAAPAADSAQAGYAVGEAHIVLPAPNANFVDMNDQAKAGVENSLPPISRLVRGYANKNDPSGISAATVQSIRPIETAILGAPDFQQFVAQTKAAMGSMDSKTTQDAIKSADKNNIIAGQPKPLGTLFERENVYASAMIVAANTPAGTVDVTVGTALMLVKGKLIIVSMTSAYKDDTSVNALKTDLDAWVKTIEDANK